jgi:hypothetical protein
MAKKSSLTPFINTCSSPFIKFLVALLSSLSATTHGAHIVLIWEGCFFSNVRSWRLMYHVGGKEINLKERKEERKRRGTKRKEEKYK